jgi:D-alanyl-D-alanine carboxypeptidase
MKNRIKTKKRILLLLSLTLVIIVSYTTITIFKNYQNNNYNFYIPKFNQAFNEQKRKLEEQHYSSKEIDLILSKISDDNINYLIENKINKELLLNIINEKYYIDNYLEKYINYYNDNQDKLIKDIIAIINTHSIDTTKELTDISKKQYTILNKYYYIDSSYPNEEEFVTIDSKYHLNNTTTKIKRITYDAFIKMYEDAPNENKFKITSAYRSFTTQEALYNYEASQNPETDTAQHGHSEHQTGYSIDIDKPNKWLKQNAHKYGFILRYPENKEHLTGYPYNENHYRYCGIDCASYIYENNITYEEYYEYYIKNKN